MTNGDRDQRYESVSMLLDHYAVERNGSAPPLPVSASPLHGHRGPQEPGSSLHDYLRVVRRRKWLILLALVLVPAAALGFSERQQKLYRADAQVLLSRQNLASVLTGTVDPSTYLQADRVAQTQADLARVPAVARRTLEAAGLNRAPADFIDHSSVSAKQNADLLDFSVTDPDPRIAAALATDYARAFVAYREQLDTASLQRARAEVQQRVHELTKKSGQLYQSLIEKDQQLATMEALQTSNASVVQPAGEAPKVQPRPARNALLGVMLGLVLGIALAFLWDALDTRIRTADEIGDYLGLPLLARLPGPSRRLRKDDQLVMLSDPGGVRAEAFRMLRTNLDFVRLGGHAKTMAITSAVAQEGKSTTIANLAVALAHAGRHVVLVDLDLRRPVLHHFFDLAAGSGLTQVALGQATLNEALSPIPLGVDAVGSLQVLRAGPLPPNPGEFSDSDSLAGILAELRVSAEIVLIDAPPALQVGDAIALSRHVDAMLIVARAKVVRRHMLTELRRLLDVVPARPLGFIVTGAEAEEGYAYGYGSHYGRRVSEPAAEAPVT